MDFAKAAAPGANAKAFLARAEHRHFIAGRWVHSASGETFDTIDPATGQPIGRMARGNASDVDAAVAAARAAFEDGRWSGLTPMERSKVLWAIADRMEANIDELAELETLDQGKALYVGRWAEIPGAINQFRYFSGMATKIEGETIPSSINYQPPGKEVFAFTQRLPVGVVGAIVPWNSPLVLTAMKLAPALAAGCTVVLKPAEDTSLTAVRLVELMMEAGLPPGVVNLVT
jgi:phenylacetaldehyde dehydrogenase